MVKNSSTSHKEVMAMNQKPKIIEPLKLKLVCKSGSLTSGQCPLLRKIQGKGTEVCAQNTYIDLGTAKPNCQKQTQLET